MSRTQSVRTGRPLLQLVGLILALLGAQPAIVSPGWAAGEPDAGRGRPLVLAQVQDEGVDGQAGDAEMQEEEDQYKRPLEPRYYPREPEKKSWYNGSYLFGMTRGVANSTMVPAAKVPLFVLTVPLDIVFLPFAAIGGLFG